MKSEGVGTTEKGQMTTILNARDSERRKRGQIDEEDGSVRIEEGTRTKNAKDESCPKNLIVPWDLQLQERGVANRIN